MARDLERRTIFRDDRDPSLAALARFRRITLDRVLGRVRRAVEIAPDTLAGGAARGQTAQGQREKLAEKLLHLAPSPTAQIAEKQFLHND